MIWFTPTLGSPSLTLTILPFYLLAMVVEIDCPHCTWSYLPQHPGDLQLTLLHISPMAQPFSPISFLWMSAFFFFFAAHSTMQHLCSKILWPMWVPQIHLLLPLSSADTRITILFFQGGLTCTMYCLGIQVWCIRNNKNIPIRFCLEQSAFLMNSIKRGSVCVRKIPTYLYFKIHRAF